MNTELIFKIAIRVVGLVIILIVFGWFFEQQMDLNEELWEQKKARAERCEPYRLSPISEMTMECFKHFKSGN